jgi:hypothetical protein
MCSDENHVEGKSATKENHVDYKAPPQGPHDFTIFVRVKKRERDQPKTVQSPHEDVHHHPPHQLVERRIPQLIHDALKATNNRTQQRRGVKRRVLNYTPKDG